MGAAYKCVNQEQGSRKECYPFSLGSSNSFRSRREEVDSMTIAWSHLLIPQVLMSTTEGRVSDSSQISLCVDGFNGRCPQQKRGFCFNGCQDSRSRGTIWLQNIQKLISECSRLKLMRRWCWRRRPPDVRWRSREEMGGHPFKNRRKNDFEKVQSVS